MYGDLSSAALFVEEKLNVSKLISLSRPIRVESQALFELCEAKQINDQNLAQAILNNLRLRPTDHDPYLRSLRGLTTAANLYQYLPHAFIDIRVLRQSLWSALWLRGDGVLQTDWLFECLEAKFQALMPLNLCGSNLFACLVMFESGTYNIDPAPLSSVMAFASGDSLYVASALMQDPYEQVDEDPHSTVKCQPVYHIIGNIGRPGITFLVSPENPMMKQPELSDWPLISHEPFDGTVIDSFATTTLHVSCTSTSAPLEIKFSGAHDIELYFLETVVSVHDMGSWIADLDILGAMKLRKQNPPPYGLRIIQPCPESRNDRVFICPEAFCQTCTLQGKGDSHRIIEQILFPRRIEQGLAL